MSYGHKPGMSPAFWRWLGLIAAAILALCVILWATGVWAQEATGPVLRDELARELHPLILQVVTALVGLLAAAALAAITWASTALRGWMKTRELLGLRRIFDDAVNNAAMKLGDSITAMRQDQVAAYFADYLTTTIPGTLDRMGAGDLHVRTAVEAAKYIRYAQERAKYEGIGPGPIGTLSVGATADPTATD